MKPTSVQMLIDYFEENFHLTEEARMEMKIAKMANEEEIKEAYDAGLFDGSMGLIQDRLHSNANDYFRQNHK